MGRSQFTFRHNLSARRAAQITESFLHQKGLKEQITKNGERVWKDGNGLILSPGFLTVYHEDCKTTVFAWIQMGLGLTARSETEIYGVAMVLPKRKMQKLLKELEQLLEESAE